MKRLAILTSVIFLAVFLSCLTILAGPSKIPHRDPASAPEKTEIDTLLFAYASVLDLVGLRNYQDAQSLLEEVGTAAIPGELRYLFQRCNALGGELITGLDSLEFLLDEIPQLITGYQLALAEGELEEAGEAVATAQQSLDDLVEAVSALSGRVVFQASVGDIMGQSYEQVEELLEGLQARIYQLDRSRLELTGTWDAKMQEGLIATHLSLNVNPSLVFWSENITMTGKLTGGGTGLGERDLVLLLGERSRPVSTGPDGSYSLVMIIPTDSYTDNLTLMAVYQVSGADLGTYLSNRSPPVTIEVDYYRTQLELTTPQHAFPGETITVSGRVSAERTPGFWTVSVLWDSLQLAERVIWDEFNIDVMPLSLTSMGEHTLEVRVLPEGRYGGISRSLPIELLPVSLNAVIDAPMIAFTPQLIEVNGRVGYEFGPLRDATVNLAFMDGVATVKTEADGSFRATIMAPLDISLIGPQGLDITIIPDEPWLGSLRVKASLVTVSPAIMGCLVLLSVVFMVWLIMKTARPIALVSPERVVLPEPLGGRVITATLSVPSRKSSVVKGGVLSVYLGAVELVARVSDISPASHTTLREYLAVASRLPCGFEAFSELTGLAELVLYSSHGPDESQDQRAGQLLASIKEELGSDAS